MHAAVSLQDALALEPLCQRLAGGNEEHTDHVVLAVVVDDPDRLADPDLQFGGHDLDRLAGRDPLGRAERDQVVVGELAGLVGRADLDALADGVVTAISQRLPCLLYTSDAADDYFWV